MKNTEKKTSAYKPSKVQKTLGPIILALIQFGSLGITNMSGSSAGTTYSHNRGGSYTRVRKVPVNPQTGAQTLVRNKFGALSAGWKLLTAAQRSGWNSATALFPRHNSLGNAFSLSGINLYKSLNQNLYNAGQATISAVPVPVGATNVTSASAVASVGGGTFVLTFAPTPTAALNTTLVFATTQLSPGISFVKNRLRLITTLPAATATGASIFAAYTAKFGALVLGQKIGLGLEAVQNTCGQKSVMLQTSLIVTA